MFSARILLALWLTASAGAAFAASPGQCLGAEQRRQTLTAHKAIPLSRAIRLARGRHGGEVVRARLCETGSGLVYVLTLLSRNGKVTRVTLDAGSGRLLGRR